VRCAGLDVTVHESDVRRRNGYLSRQGSPVLRWAVFEAAQTAARPASPDHSYYLERRCSTDHRAVQFERRDQRRDIVGQLCVEERPGGIGSGATGESAGMKPS
jgi:transposase